MAFPNQQNTLTSQQIAALLNMLGQQPQANPISASFNPSYFSSLMNLANQTQSQTQPQPQATSTNYVIVRTVEDPSEIEAQEVTMGVYNIFPSLDCNHIYVKSWNKEGLIENLVYSLANEDKPKDMRIDISDLEKRVKALETSVAKLKKQKSTKPSVKNVDVSEEVKPNE